METLKYDTFTIRQYHRESLLYELKLNREDMPLLATLAGNDLIAWHYVKDFIRSLGTIIYKFYNIAKFIKDNHGLREDFSKIAEFLMPSVDRTKAIELISNSLNQYNLNRMNDTEFHFESTIESQIKSSPVYEILMGLPIILTVGCFSYK